MKFKLAFLFILVSILTFSQTILEGSYRLTNGGGFYGDSYVFTKDGRFEFSSGHCTGGSYGKGSYKIKTGLLKLYFKDSISESKTTFDYENNDTVKINQLKIVVFDALDSSAIPFCNILFLQSDSEKDYKYGTSTNEKGEAWVDLNFCDFKFLSINYVAFNIVKIPKASLKNVTTLNVYLGDLFSTESLSSKDNCQFRIKKIKNDGFSLKPKGQKEYLKYKKIKKAPQ